MNFKILIAVAFVLFVTTIKASSEGMDQSTLDNYLITGFSRPCCSFGLDTMGVKMGIAAVIAPVELGEHHFARLNKSKDNVGMVYTCGAGFVDVS
ncbi:MAG: hypothetical protein H0V66_02375, partial [Bdellovibrionales bacterium]|nr:hypothetical protein [Bdellovibrionales bacterium]